MNPVTEIGFFTFTPTANLQDVTAGVDAISDQQPGIRHIRWGVEEHDPTKIQLIANWDGQRYHEQYTKSTDYVVVGGILTPILAASPVVFHAHLDQEILATVLEAPVVELITFYSVSDGFQDILRRALSSRYSLFVDAPIIEELVQQPGSTNGSAHFAAIARDSGVECSEDYTLSGTEGFETTYVRYMA